MAEQQCSRASKTWRLAPRTPAGETDERARSFFSSRNSPSPTIALKSQVSFPAGKKRLFHVLNPLRCAIAFWISIAQRTASTTLRNSTIKPSSVRLTTRPL